MKITIQELPDCEELEIIIHCRQMDEGTARILAYLGQLDKKLVGVKDGRTFVLEPGEIFYCESVDKRTFLYCEQEVYETPLRLYELEARLEGGSFFRASKSTILNLARIDAFRTSPLGGGKIEVTMDNGERLYVSRAFVPVLKEKLGI